MVNIDLSTYFWFGLMGQDKAPANPLIRFVYYIYFFARSASFFSVLTGPNIKKHERA